MPPFFMSINFNSAVENDKRLQHQIDAWNFLQTVIHKEILDEFARIYRNEQKYISGQTPKELGLPICGVDLIKEFEGCELKAYYDPLTGGLPITIGWGSTRRIDGTRFLIGTRITQKEADDLLLYHLKNFYLPRLQKIPYWDQMNENQKGALLSFAYNLGADFYGNSDFDTITKVLKNKEWDKVPETFTLYRNPGTKVEQGLLRRRKAEGDLWKKKL